MTVSYIRQKFFLIACTMSISLFAMDLFATEITIFHTNDIKGNIFSKDKAIGYGKIATIVNEARDNGENVLFLDAGDSLYGSSFVNFSKGEVVVDILNSMKIDAIALGDQDFNYGVQNLIGLSKRADFPFLVSNMIDNNGKSVFVNNIVKTFGDVRVGIFGVTTPEVLHKTNAKNIQGYTFLDATKAAQDQVYDLKRKGAVFIIALTHLGISKNSNMLDRSTYLSTVEGIDLIIDGHSQSVLPKGERIKNTIITQAGGNGEYLGKIVVKIDDERNSVAASIIKGSSLLSTISDNKVKNVIKEYEDKQNTKLSEKVLDLPISLMGDRKTINIQETNFGILATNIMRNLTKADVAIVNSGSFKASLNKGEVTLGDILESLPYEDELLVTELTGGELKEVLEQSVARLPNIDSAFLQVSGISFQVNLSKKAGGRVSNILVDNKPIEENKIYKIATTDFIYHGGDFYRYFHNKNILYKYGILRDYIVNFLKKNDMTTYEFNKNIIFQIK